MIRVFICSPYAGNVERNVAYARLAMADSFSKLNEAPFVPHLLYPQVLDDRIEEHRQLAIQCCIEYLDYCDLLAVYADFGISSGMEKEIAYAKKWDIPKEERRLPKELLECVTEAKKL